MTSQTLLSSSSHSDSEIGRSANGISLHSRKRPSSNLNLSIHHNDSVSPHTLVEDVEHAAFETFLLTRLAFKLFSYLGLGYKWISKFILLLTYAALLMPGFLQAMYYYFFSGRVLRSIVYGDQPRNRLDIFFPSNKTNELRPVVIFVTGGAWVIGYKAWGTLLGWSLSDNDIIVVSLDYRNFPQGCISDMLADVECGISWVFDNISLYGGDPTRITLVGQSAGSHLSAMVVVNQAIRESIQNDRMPSIEYSSTESNQSKFKQSKECFAKETSENSIQATNKLPSSLPSVSLSTSLLSSFSFLSWRSSQLKAFIGISGCYNLCEIVDHFHNRGLNRSIFHSLMEGEDKLTMYSPELVVQSSSFSLHNSVCFLPDILLFHGSSDYSVPYSATIKFSSALKSIGANVHAEICIGKTHTDLIIQDPMRGGRDEVLEAIVLTAYGNRVGDEDGIGGENGSGDKKEGNRREHGGGEHGSRRYKVGEGETSKDDFKIMVDSHGEFSNHCHQQEQEHQCVYHERIQMVMRRRMVPEFLLKAANSVSPF